MIWGLQYRGGAGRGGAGGGGQKRKNDFVLSFLSRGHAWKRRAGARGRDREKATHVKATRPVDLLMPSQVPPACTSRPESTLSLALTWSADGAPSLEAEAEETGVVDEASNEWKDAGRVGRARSSSRFAHKMLWSLRGQREMEKKRMGRAQF